ncbi:hypothetical protein WM23_07705 [Burkholderia ubonensis]|nr:hypothetical protein WM23_07705 [Burkholderia ubonensis]
MGAGLVVSHGGAYWGGGGGAQQALLAEQAREVVQFQQQQQTLTQALEHAYAQRQESIRTVYRDRVVVRNKEVPREVLDRQDAGCRIPARFVSMWNDANRLQLSEPAHGVDETPSAVSLTDVESQHEREARLYHETAEQLSALQRWVSAQQGLTGHGRGDEPNALGAGLEGEMR